jgi:PAS domain S-box-containing protein
MPAPSAYPENASPAALHLAAIVGSSDDAIISKNLSGIIQSWNKAAERIFGYTAEEAVGQPILLIIPPHLKHEERYILERLRRGDRIEHFETTRLRKDGRLIDISLTISPIRDGEGKIIGASKIARDITEHKATRTRLDELQQRLTVTLQSIGDAVVATDAETRVTFINRLAEQLLGRPEHEILGRPLETVFTILHEITRHPIPNPVHAVLQNRKVTGLTHHTILVRPDGSELPIDDSAAPIFDSAGQIVGVVLVFRDVTEHRQANRLATRLSSIVASSDDAIISKDLTGIVMTWNRGAERIFGYSAEEMVGQSITKIIPADRQTEERDILAKLARGEHIDHYETVRRKKDGTLLDISLTVSPMKDEDGHIIGASKIARDITAQKRAQRTIHEAQERWLVTLSSIGDAVIATDAQARMTFANPVALQLLGGTLDEVIGKPLVDYFHIVNEETRRPAVNPVDRVIREGIVVGLANHTVLVRPGGVEVPIDDTAAPIRDADGQLVGVVLVFRDITERKTAERELFRWSTELERRVAERTEQLVRSQDRLRALAAQLSRTEQRERRRLATNLHDYLAQLLALARIKIGQMKPGPGRVAAEVQPALIELDNILHDCLRYTRTLMGQLSPSVLHDVGFVPAVQWLAEQMGQQGLNVTVQVLAPNMPRIPDTMADVLFQAVRELLLNVLKHARVSEAVISVEKREGDEWLIAVEDHGVGFDPNVMRHRATDEQFGLFSIQERMEAISGWCRIHSIPGRGTRIELGLAMGGDEEAPSRRKTISQPRAIDGDISTAGSRSRVLLVDDHAMVRQGLRSILETYADLEIVAEAVDGEEAVSLAYRLQPDVVLMDVNLPGLNGIEATHRIKQAWPHIVVIGLSVQSSPQTIQALADAGGAALLSKEQATEELYRTIQRFVKLSRQH